MVQFGQSKPDGLGYIDVLHHQYRPLCPSLESKPGAQGPPPILLRRPVEGSMRLFFKKPVTMSRTSPISLLRILVTRTSLSCSTRTPLSLTLRCLPSGRAPKAKALGACCYSSFVHCCAAPHFPGHQLSHFCSVHIHNVVAKKRDASAELLQRLHGYMNQHSVDFIEGDFNMSALSTVGDVFSDREFSAPGNSFLWVLGALEEQYRERTGFLIKWRVDSHGCYKFDNAALGFGPRDDQSVHLLMFLHQHHAQRTCTTKKNGTEASQT